MRAVLLLLLLFSAGDAELTETLEPKAGTAARRELAPGATHDYLLELTADHLLHVVVEQEGVDLEAVLLDPEGRRLVASDRPISYQGPEELLAVSERSGVFRVMVRALGAPRPAGRYELRIVTLRPADDGDRLRAAAAALLSAGDDFRRRGEWRPAIEAYGQALRRWHAAGHVFREAETLNQIGRVHGGSENWREASEAYREAAVRFRAAGDERWEAIALGNLGRALNEAGETEMAILQYERARPLSRRAGDRRSTAIAAYSLGQIHAFGGEPQKAIDDFREAFELLDEVRDRALQADVRYLLGVLYRQLGHWTPAEDQLRAAYRAYSELDDRERQAKSLNQLGQLALDQDELPAALAAYREALELRRRAGDAAGEALTLKNIGRIHQRQGDRQRAAEHYRQALDLLEGANQPEETARVLLAHGSLLEQRGQPAEAIVAYRRALGFFRGTSDRAGEVETLAGIAAAERRQGRLQTARVTAEEALAILEAVRPRLLRQDLRTAFFAAVQAHYELYVDLLMEMHRAAPEEGHDGNALEASERARSRSLLDLLAETGRGSEAGIDPRLRTRRREIQLQLNELADRRLGPVGREEASASGLEQIDREIRELIEQLEAVQGEIRRDRQAHAEAEPLSLVDVQREILDDDTVLLEYKLGHKRSFLWLVTRHALASFELPARGEIEELTRTAHQHLARSRQPASRMAASRALCTLSRWLVGATGDLLAGKRLLIVPDGVLSYLPFSALPDPGHAGGCSAPPLVFEHEITYLPSASVLKEMRRDSAGRRRPPGLLAVVADPVLSRADERMTGGGVPEDAVPRSDLTRSAADLSLGPFVRLVHSGREAEALLSLVPAERSFRALGFEATKDVVTSGRLAGYRIVHLATHGLLNPIHPELSGLVLSLVDETGAPRDGFLRAHEIRYLELPADLAVLSACQTALGKEVRGEGLMGLTRAFFHAGTRRVMVSLWPVGDLGTAELMERFYRRLLDEGMRPAAALREAQLAMWRHETWSAPYHWAGFVIQGEPR